MNAELPAIDSIVTQQGLGYNGVVVDHRGACAIIRWHKWQDETFTDPEFDLASLIVLGKVTANNEYPNVRTAELAKTVTLGKCTLIPHADPYRFEVRSGVWYYNPDRGWIKAESLVMGGQS